MIPYKEEYFAERGAENPMSYIEFHEVCRDYVTGDSVVHAADHVSFGIEKGELCVILGHSGAGKTTVLNLLGGMDRASAGRITVGDKVVTDMSDHELTEYRRLDVGFVFQFYNLMHNLTALENVELAEQVCPNALDPRAVMEQVGLADRMGLLCDEPTGALDSKTGEQVLELLTRLCRDYRTTVVIITHNAAIAPLGNRIIRLKNGMVQEVVINKRPMRVEDIQW